MTPRSHLTSLSLTVALYGAIIVSLAAALHACEVMR